MPIYSTSPIDTFTFSGSFIEKLLSLADQTDRDDFKYTNLLVHHIASSISTLLFSLTLKYSSNGIQNLREHYGCFCLYDDPMPIEHPVKGLLLSCCVQESGCPTEQSWDACHFGGPVECVDATGNVGWVVQGGYFQTLPVVEENVADRHKIYGTLAVFEENAQG